MDVIAFCVCIGLGIAARIAIDRWPSFVRGALIGSAALWTAASAAAAPHLPISPDEFGSRVNSSLSALESDQAFRLRRLNDGSYGGSANANAVLLGTTEDSAYVTDISVTFAGTPTRKDNAAAKAIGVAVIATAEDTDLVTARAVYNNLVESLARKGYGTADLGKTTYRLIGATPPAILTIKPN